MPPRKGKGKQWALEVPPNISLAKAKALLAEFNEPGDHKLIQQVLLDSAPPPSTSPDVQMAHAEPTVPQKCLLPPKTLPNPFDLIMCDGTEFLESLDREFPTSLSPVFLWDNFFKKMEFASHSINSSAKVVAFTCIALNFLFCSLHKEGDKFKNLIFDSDNVTIGNIISELSSLGLTPPPPPPPPPQIVPPLAGQSPALKKMKTSANLPSKPVPKLALCALVPKPVAPTAPPKMSSVPLVQKDSSPKPTPSCSAQHWLCHCCASHTTHGLSQREIYLTPPAGSKILASDFTPNVITRLNQLIQTDLKSQLVIESVHTFKSGIHMDTKMTPCLNEMVFMLKHIHCLFPAPQGATPIASIHPMSTFFLKVVDVPISQGSSQEWAAKMQADFVNQLKLSPVSLEVAKNIKHLPCVMRNSPHSDSAMVWINLHNTVSGHNAKALIGEFICIGVVNCCITGVKPMLVPFYAPGARGGAIILVSATLKVCAVPYAVSLTLRLTI
jgi:hypothetical protein